MKPEERRKNEANLTAASALAFGGRHDSRERARSAEKAAERFLRASSLLPEGEKLGWQLDAEDLRAVAFAGAGAGTEPADCDWVFRPCAAAVPLPGVWKQDLYENGRRVYGLTVPVQERAGEPEEYGSGVIGSDDPLRDLFDMLALAGAVVRFEAGGESRVRISVPDAMTLRLRAALAMAFPPARASEILSPDEPGKALPDEVFRRIMARILSERMRREKRDPGPEVPDGEWTCDLEEEDADDVPIEELDLSLRSFNCLMRAGIRTAGQLRAMSDEELFRIRNLGRKNVEEIREKLAEATCTLRPLPDSAPEPEEDPMEALESLVGLGEVKEQVRRIAAFARMRAELPEEERKRLALSLNMAFEGNPGTAKTTVARILAGVFHRLGLLQSPEPVEAGRADLVARYEGQTAGKVRDLFDRADGRLLFVDEAYSLVEDGAGRYGDEAIAALVQEMENRRDRTVVVFAGYPEKMEEFLSRNPGLRSRVPFRIGFPDYTPEEMANIARAEADRRGFFMEPGAEEKVREICRSAGRGPEAGNGRLCRNLVENAVLSYASRTYGSGEGRTAADRTLRSEDFSPPPERRAVRKSAVGFLG